MTQTASIQVYAALLSNLLVAFTKTAAAAVTGSSAMLSEAVHSFVDTGNELLLLYGMRQARRGPDTEHPLGYGRELYFWSFIVALLVFAIGSGVSIWQGILELQDPEPIAHAGVSYAVLLLSFLFEGGSWLISQRAFRSGKGDRGYWEAIRASKDPPKFIVLLEDSAALCGIVIAFLATIAAEHLQEPRLDGLASIVIGILLGGVAVVLARESKALLIGERADLDVRSAILSIAEHTTGVKRVNGMIAVQLAPDQIAAVVSAEFDKELTTLEIEEAVAKIEDRLRREQPTIRFLCVKPQSRQSYDGARRHAGTEHSQDKQAHQCGV